jgi:hypothetical protein
VLRGKPPPERKEVKDYGQSCIMKSLITRASVVTEFEEGRIRNHMMSGVCSTRERSRMHAERGSLKCLGLGQKIILNGTCRNSIGVC